MAIRARYLRLRFRRVESCGKAGLKVAGQTRFLKECDCFLQESMQGLNSTLKSQAQAPTVNGYDITYTLPVLAEAIQLSTFNFQLATFWEQPCMQYSVTVHHGSR